MAQLTIGLENLQTSLQHQEIIQGRIAYLCHSASINKNLIHGLEIMKSLFKERLTKIFGPQHGFVTDVQDNMVETEDFTHPYFNLPVFSLYGETRVPTDSMLEGIDTLVVDLQDVGTRVYTYITTLALTMEACAKKGIRVVVLDRPNPAGASIIEGNILDHKWKSFVGHHPIPMRHAMTMGEIGHLQKNLFTPECDYHVIAMKNYQRESFWPKERLWVNPSPNLSTPESCIIFPGTVLFEGTQVSEGRGTTRALEVLGAPQIESFSFRDQVVQKMEKFKIEGVTIRPQNFYPMFQKFAATPCGGIHLHPQKPEIAKTWRLGQMLLQCFRDELKENFQWNKKPYEYETRALAIDFINGGPELREWVESNGSLKELEDIEMTNRSSFLKSRKEVLLY